MPRWWIGLTQFSFGFSFEIFKAINYLTFGLLFFKVKALRTENLKGLRNPVIIVSNHKTIADFCFIISSSCRTWKFLSGRTVGADWLFKIPDYKGGFLLRWLVRSIGADPAQRGSGPEKSLQRLMGELRKGHTVYLHPEGGIYCQPGIFQIKRGVAYLAQNSGVPVLPIAIRGVEYFSPQAFFFGRRKVEVIFGKPLILNPEKSSTEATDEVWQAINDLYQSNSSPG